MVLNLFGGGGSGKTTLQMELLKIHGFANLVPFTTRKPRAGEKEGLHYHYVSETAFKTLELIMVREANGYFYGVRKENLYSADIIITTFDLNGIEVLEKLTLGLKIVYLNISEQERIERMILRGDTIEQVSKRVVDDKAKIVFPRANCPILEINDGSIKSTIEKILTFVR